MAIQVKFIGAFRHISGKTQLNLQFDNGSSVRSLVNLLIGQMPELRSTLSDQGLNDSRSNSLILVNGREISILDGYETKLFDNDEVVFVPVVHGG